MTKRTRVVDIGGRAGTIIKSEAVPPAPLDLASLFSESPVDIADLYNELDLPFGRGASELVHAVRQIREARSSSLRYLADANTTIRHLTRMLADSQETEGKLLDVIGDYQAWYNMIKSGEVGMELDEPCARNLCRGHIEEVTAGGPLKCNTCGTEVPKDNKDA